MSLSDVFFHYMSQIGAISVLEFFNITCELRNRVKNSLVFREVIFSKLQPLYYKRNVASPYLLPYLQSMCSQEIYSLFPPVQTFRVRERYTASIGSNHSHFVSIPEGRR